MESEEMAALIQELILDGRYDLVVIDTPPAAMIADAIPLMKLVDGVIVVGQIGKTTRDEAVHLRDQLRELDAPALGVVANRARTRRGYYGYYGYSREEGRRSVLGLRIGRRASAGPSRSPTSTQPRIRPHGPEPSRPVGARPAPPAPPHPTAVAPPPPEPASPEPRVDQEAMAEPDEKSAPGPTRSSVPATEKRGRLAAPWRRRRKAPAAQAQERIEQPAAEAVSNPPLPDAPVNLNQATYEELRRLKLSITLTSRVLAHRESNGGFKSLDELDQIPGFSKAQLSAIKRHLTL
jgi:hypothetical protein